MKGGEAQLPLGDGLWSALDMDSLGDNIAWMATRTQRLSAHRSKVAHVDCNRNGSNEMKSHSANQDTERKMHSPVTPSADTIYLLKKDSCTSKHPMCSANSYDRDLPPGALLDHAWAQWWPHKFSGWETAALGQTVGKILAIFQVNKEMGSIKRSSKQHLYAFLLPTLISKKVNPPLKA